METVHHTGLCPQLYSELTTGNPDFIDLSGRCVLLTQILLDCEIPEQTRPICRALLSYLDALKTSLDDSMTDFCLIELTTDHPLSQEKEWLLADSETQCEHCQALVNILLTRTMTLFSFRIVVSLLHDLVHYMADELKAPRFSRKMQSG